MFGFRGKSKITILGSCVSRDIFEFLDVDRYEISQYFARTKVISQLSPPLMVDGEEVNLQSDFQKRLVLNDLNKTEFDIISDESGDFCIIDYIDERFNFIKINDTCITKSNELMNCGWLKERKYTEHQYFLRRNIWWVTDSNERLEDYLKLYLDKILNYYKRKKVIIHKAYMLDYYLDKNGKIRTFSKAHLVNNHKVNMMLKYMYDYTEYYLQKAKIIDISEKYKADENHKWGLATMHYQKEYYYEAAELLKKYISL